MTDGNGALVAVDWGTSRLRAMLLDADGAVLEERESGDGIGALSGGHEAAFEKLAGGWPKAPAIMAGMVGSRQGWHEAAYAPCPATIADLAAKVLRFETSGGRPVAIVPGVMLRDPHRDGDVIRGEETQIAGVIAGEPDFAGICILPGTHSKWATVRGGAIVEFQTYLSGEMFELLSKHSFLRHSVAADGRELSADPDFVLGVTRMAKDGLPFLASVFSVRARQLLDGVSREANLAYLSGLVIGGEIAAARSAGRLAENTFVRVIGAPALAQAYSSAFAILKRAVRLLDGGEMVTAGLVNLARTIGMLPERKP